VSKPNATLTSVVALLAERRIGAALVLGVDRRIAGIVSERDIVRALGERGTAALDDPVSRIMTRRVSTCTEAETISSIMERMTEGKFPQRRAQIENKREDVAVLPFAPCAGFPRSTPAIVGFAASHRPTSVTSPRLPELKNAARKWRDALKTFC
jgi:hypothetical protein